MIIEIISDLSQSVKCSCDKTFGRIFAGRYNKATHTAEIRLAICKTGEETDWINIGRQTAIVGNFVEIAEQPEGGE